jgi:hypothetical protein
VTVQAGNRRLTLSNLDKQLYADGFTKGEVIINRISHHEATDLLWLDSLVALLPAQPALRCGTTIASNTYRSPRRDNFARGSAASEVA